MSTSYAFRQILGKRSNQEDNLLVIDVPLAEGKPGTLWLICDGMGGHSSGELASKIVTSVAARSFSNGDGTIRDRLIFAAEQANQAIADKVEADSRLRGMGTTLVAVCICERMMYWYSVGDSSLWLLRHNHLQRLNEDHSMAAVLDKRQGRDEATKTTHWHGRHFLMSALNGRKPDLVDCPLEPFILQESDQLLLATDGIDTLLPLKLQEILNQNSELPVDINMAAIFNELERLKNPQQDNASAILIRIDSTEKSEQPSEKHIPGLTDMIRSGLNKQQFHPRPFQMPWKSLIVAAAVALAVLVLILLR